MRIGLVGSPRDLHLRRWGAALARAGAEVQVFGLENPPQDAVEKAGLKLLSEEPPLEYIVVGKGIAQPNYGDFLRQRKKLAYYLQEYEIEVAHPIYLSPYGVWVYWSGFRPYIPFAMGVELEYTAWGRRQAQRGFWTSHPILTPLRHHLLPPLLRRTLQNAAFSLADNYTLCENIKLLHKNKTSIEMPAGIRLEGEGGDRVREVIPEVEQEGAWVLAPRGITRFYQADYILEGFAQYWNQGGHLHLLLLSNLYSAEKNILEILESLSKKFSDKIKIITSLLSPAEMRAVWKKVVAFISVPSYDGYSYSVAEGRWAGAIPLLNAIPGNLEVATHSYNALLIHPFTPENLASTLHHLEKELPTLQATFTKRNQKWIKHFSDIDRHAHLFLRMLSELLRKTS